MPRGTEQLLVAAAVGAGRRLVTAEPSWVAERRRRCNLSGVWATRPAVAVAVAVEGVRTPVTPFVVPSASSVRRADVRPLVGRASGVHATGVHATGVHATGAIRVSGRTRVRCIGTVRTALDPRMRRCGGAAHPWASGWRCRGGRRAAWSSLPESGLAGKGWSFVGCAWLAWGDGRPGPPLRLRTGCGAWPTMGAGSSARVPVGGWGAREGAGAPKSPAGASWAGGRRDARHGAIPGGDDHAPWSLCWCWSRVVQLRRAHLVRRGAGCGRAAAAVREVRCR
jgi:hypothetical protein